jgi:glycerol uptake facilitator-like aquaporin
LDAVKSQSPWMRLLAECTAELFGTAILVLFGCSGIAQFTLSSGRLSSFLSVSFAFGFGALIAVYVAGPVSGKFYLLFLSVKILFAIRCSY